MSTIIRDLEIDANSLVHSIGCLLRIGDAEVVKRIDYMNRTVRSEDTMQQLRCHQMVDDLVDLLTDFGMTPCDHTVSRDKLEAVQFRNIKRLNGH